MTLRRAAAGFTLLELIVVVAIFGLFAVMAYGGLNATLKTRVEVERAQDRLGHLQKAYLRLRDDIQQVAARPVRDGYGDEQPPLRGLERPQMLDFTRGGWRNPASVMRSTLERVSYRVEDGKLIRASFRVLDQAQDSKAQDVVVLEQVESLELRYLDENREWRSRWPPDSADTRAADQPPPLAVEVKLETRDLGELTFLFRIGIERIRQLPGSSGGIGGETTGGTTGDAGLTGGTTGGSSGGAGGD